MFDFINLLGIATQPAITPAHILTAINTTRPDYQRSAFFTAAKLLPANFSGVAGQQTFVQNYNNAFAEAIVNIARYTSFNQALQLPQKDHVMVCGWFFPELIQYIQRTVSLYNVLVLVSEDAPWFSNLKAAGNTLNFQQPDSFASLTTQMQSGRNIFSMLDNIHAGTRSINATFFGGTIPIPSAILDLAIQNNYTLAFLVPDGGATVVTATIPATGQTAVQLANWYSANLSHAVAANPARWLMWPALRSAM